MRSWAIGLGVSGLLLLSSGCNSLQYLESEELWARGDAAFDEGRYDDSLPYYSELVKREHDDSRALLFRGVARERDGDPRGALRDLSKAGDLGETRGLLYSADLNITNGDFDAAEADLGALRDAGLTGRDRVVQLTLLGTLRLKQNRPRMAAQNFERAAKEGAAFQDRSTRRHVADAHYNAAQAYYQMGDFQRAYEHFRGYMNDAGGGSGRDHYMMGLLAYLAGDFDTADQHLAQADPDLVERGAKILDDPGFGARR
jgi:tetratricopeptide (TPR) repeat protein